jgi:hypothetical protein
LGLIADAKMITQSPLKGANQQKQSQAANPSCLMERPDKKHPIIGYSLFSVIDVVSQSIFKKRNREINKF